MYSLHLGNLLRKMKRMIANTSIPRPTEAFGIKYILTLWEVEKFLRGRVGLRFHFLWDFYTSRPNISREVFQNKLCVLWWTAFLSLFSKSGHLDQWLFSKMDIWLQNVLSHFFCSKKGFLQKKNFLNFLKIKKNCFNIVEFFKNWHFIFKSGWAGHFGVWGGL